MLLRREMVLLYGVPAFQEGSGSTLGMVVVGRRCVLRLHGRASEPDQAHHGTAVAGEQADHPALLPDRGVPRGQADRAPAAAERGARGRPGRQALRQRLHHQSGCIGTFSEFEDGRADKCVIQILSSVWKAAASANAAAASTRSALRRQPLEVSRCMEAGLKRSSVVAGPQEGAPSERIVARGRHSRVPQHRYRRRRAD